MTEWTINTLKGHTIQEGDLHVHEIIFTKGCISKLPTGELAVLLDDEDIKGLIADLGKTLTLLRLTGNNEQYSDASLIANRMANIE